MRAGVIKAWCAFGVLECLMACSTSTQPAIPQVRPVEGGWISSAFGLREQHPILGWTPGRLHEGFDFAVPEGTPVRATAAGTVRKVALEGGYGKIVVIDHASGYASLYGHLRDWWVQPGQLVDAGTPIAAVGSTGLSTGPHLHYAWLKDGRPIDPGVFTPGEGGDVMVKPPVVPAPPTSLALVGDATGRGVMQAMVRLDRPARTDD